MESHCVIALSLAFFATQIVGSSSAVRLMEEPSHDILIGRYPGYPGPLMARGYIIARPFLDGIRFHGNIMGVDIESSGGWHIHSGTTCANHSEVGGHLLTPGGNDPWDLNVWNSDQFGNATINETDNGMPLRDIVGHALVVHSGNGTRVGCGIVPQNMTGNGTHPLDPRVLVKCLTNHCMVVLLKTGCLLRRSCGDAVACLNRCQQSNQACPFDCLRTLNSNEADTAQQLYNCAKGTCVAFGDPSGNPNACSSQQDACLRMPSCSDWRQCVKNKDCSSFDLGCLSRCRPNHQTPGKEDLSLMWCSLKEHLKIAPSDSSTTATGNTKSNASGSWVIWIVPVTILCGLAMGWAVYRWKKSFDAEVMVTEILEPSNRMTKFVPKKYDIYKAREVVVGMVAFGEEETVLEHSSTDDVSDDQEAMLGDDIEGIHFIKDDLD